MRKLRAGMMPPPGARRPPAAEYAALRDWLESEIDRTAEATPGTKVLHRFNRTEYANAIRDLLDLEIDPATLLPADDSSRGFDNIAGSLTISPDPGRDLRDGGDQDRPHRSRLLEDADRVDLHQADRQLAEPAYRRPAVGHPRRHDGAPRVPRRRRLHVHGPQPRRRHLHSGRGAGALHRRPTGARVALRGDGGLPRHGRGARRPPGGDAARHVRLARRRARFRGYELPAQPGRGEALRPQVAGKRGAYGS